MSRPQVIALVFITFVIVVGGTFLLIGLLQTDDDSDDTAPASQGSVPVASPLVR